jgi:drug/metabolite transporter (DMT)-like permease
MDIIVICLTLFSALLWGISPLIVKHLLEKINHYTIMILFSGVYFLCLLIALPYFDNDFVNDCLRLKKIDILLILIQSVVVLFLGNIIYFYVLKDNNTSVITALESCSPFFTFIFAYILLNEKLNLIGVLGLTLIVLGVGCISFNDAKFDLIIPEYFVGRD